MKIVIFTGPRKIFGFAMHMYERRTPMDQESNSLVHEPMRSTGKIRNGYEEGGEIYD